MEAEIFVALLVLLLTAVVFTTRPAVTKLFLPRPSSSPSDMHRVRSPLGARKVTSPTQDKSGKKERELFLSFFFLSAHVRCTA